jgi:hypothetical protein
VSSYLPDLSGVSWSSCQRILSKELQMKRVAVKFVPHVLKADQKQSRVDACRELKEHLEIDPAFFRRLLLVMKAGVRLQPRDKAAVKRTEEFNFTASQKKRSE